MRDFIYSDSLNAMVRKERKFKGETYIWNDSDCVYYNDAEEILFAREIDVIEL